MSTTVKSGIPKSWAETPPTNPALRGIISEVVENQTWLEKIANPFQSWVNNLFGKQGEAQYVAKDLLNGTWLGHPLHPVLTDVPLGAWTMTTAFDLIDNDDEGLQRGADLSLLIGLAGATGAAVTGI